MRRFQQSCGIHLSVEDWWNSPRSWHVAQHEGKRGKTGWRDNDRGEWDILKYGAWTAIAKHVSELADWGICAQRMRVVVV